MECIAQCMRIICGSQKPEKKKYRRVTRKKREKDQIVINQPLPEIELEEEEEKSEEMSQGHAGEEEEEENDEKQYESAKYINILRQRIEELNHATSTIQATQSTYDMLTEEEDLQAIEQLKVDNQLELNNNMTLQAQMEKFIKEMEKKETLRTATDLEEFITKIQTTILDDDMDDYPIFLLH